MEGPFQPGWYYHNTLGLIKISQTNGSWYYQCYKSNGSKPISNKKPLDQWTWAMSEEEERD